MATREAPGTRHVPSTPHQAPGTDSGRQPPASPSLLFTLVVSALILAPTLTYWFGLDQGTFAYMAAELLEGRWPYIDTWDHQMPGGIVLHAAQIAILGKSIVMFRVADLIYQLVNVTLIYAITKRLADRPSAFLAAATYALIYQNYGAWNTGQREGFGLLFVLAAVYLYLTASRRPDGRTAFLIGLAIGLAGSIKLVFLAFPVMFAPLLFTRAVGGLAPRARLVLMLTAVAGMVLPIGMIVLLYWRLGALRDLYEATVAYQTQVYVHRLRGTDPPLAYWWSKIVNLGPRPILLALACAPLLAIRERRDDRLIVFLGYLIAVGIVFVQGTFAGYHFLPALGLGAILLGCLFFEAMRRIGWSGAAPSALARIRPAHVALAIVVVAAPIYIRWHRIRNLASLTFLRPPSAGALRVGTVFDFTEAYDTAQFLKSHTDSRDRIQVWGHESLVYYLAERDAASRFQSSNELVMRVPGQPITVMQQAWRREFLDDIEKNPPRYFVIVRGDRWWWAPGEQTSEELIDDFPELKAQIGRSYEHDRTIGRYLVYRFRASGAGTAGG